MPETTPTTTKPRAIAVEVHEPLERYRKTSVPDATTRWRPIFSGDTYTSNEFGHRFMLTFDKGNRFGVGLKLSIGSVKDPDSDNPQTFLGGGIVAEQVIAEGRYLTLSAYQELTAYALRPTTFSAEGGAYLYFNFDFPLRPFVGAGGIYSFGNDWMGSGLTTSAGIAF